MAPSGKATRALAALGDPLVRALDYTGGLCHLLAGACHWFTRSIVLRQVRFGRPAFYSQIVRLGVRSVGVVALVSSCIGIILALQMAPPLSTYGQTAQVATIIAIAVVRELGPLITAIVMTGFAGASIAAEIGTMVVGEEIEALDAMALDPVRFLVLPRMLASALAVVVLCLLGIWIAIASGYYVGVHLLDIPAGIYWSNTLDALDLTDFATGLWKALVFGILIAAIACYNGLAVTGGAAGVGRATTNTVVHSIMLIIFADLLFTAVFYRLGWT
jgi:phospholipid/cholesterol/gamma-HCH transport system permease protein